MNQWGCEFWYGEYFELNPNLQYQPGRDAYSYVAEEVRKDIAEARHLGVNGVPYFVIDRKYAVSGAQEMSVFLETLKKAYDGWEKTTRT